jgi:hypothetical protein
LHHSSSPRNGLRERSEKGRQLQQRHTTHINGRAQQRSDTRHTIIFPL